MFDDDLIKGLQQHSSKAILHVDKGVINSVLGLVSLVFVEPLQQTSPGLSAALCQLCMEWKKQNLEAYY